MDYNLLLLLSFFDAHIACDLDSGNFFKLVLMTHHSLSTAVISSHAMESAISQGALIHFF